jgi:CubicO group peptidase (beta-lactamase class C family)
MLIGLALVTELWGLDGHGMTTYDLRAELEAARVEFHLPAMAALIVKDGRVLASQAVGVRKMGSDIPVTTADKFHIGSCTKSITATLAAMLVDDGKLSWETRISDVFPTTAVNSDLQNVTVEQLLCHRSGVRGDLTDDEMDRYMHSPMKPMDQRNELMLKLLPEAPVIPSGSAFSYSNLGVTVAGAMLEHIAHKPWEVLVHDRIFKPLGMRSAGFGPPASVGEVDEPWGHMPKPGGGYDPIPPGPEADNPPVLGPAATVHCSLTDFAKFAMMYLEASKGHSRLLSKKAFDKIVSLPYDQDYAHGWNVVTRDWAQGIALNHAGSNTMFYTVIWVAPATDFAIIVATNAGDENAKTATDRVVHNTIVAMFRK